MKAMTEKSIDQLLVEAKAKYEALSPEEKTKADQAQKESFVRAMTTPCEHGVLDFEDCHECWGKWR